MLDVAQELKALAQILETKPYSFSIDLAALASRRDYLNLEKWLVDNIAREGEPFIVATIEFVKDKIRNQFVRQQMGENATVASMPLSADVAQSFLKVLNSHVGYVTINFTAFFIASGKVAITNVFIVDNAHPQSVTY